MLPLRRRRGHLPLGRRARVWPGTSTAPGLFNAVVATGIAASRWAAHFDTVSVCFSKGLGAPVGSALVGPRGTRSPRPPHRKALGGGMRQAGIIAAGALYALEHHVERLAEDHANAQVIAAAVRESRRPGARPAARRHQHRHLPRRRRAAAPPPNYAAGSSEHGVLMMPFAKQKVRAVTHLDVTADQVKRAADALPAAAS